MSNFIQAKNWNYRPVVVRLHRLVKLQGVWSQSLLRVMEMNNRQETDHVTVKSTFEHLELSVIMWLSR